MTTKKKIAASVGAVGLTAIIALGGTFAWQSISQQALNEAMATINPGGRLHDDFNGRNKDVYVENFTEDGTAIFARVRLDEYMEIGTGAGTGENAVSVVDGAEFDNKTTWTTRTPAGSTLLDEEGNAYWTWEMGGQGVYMPTFNKNKDSLQADINGTYDATDGTNHYTDYVEYEVVNTETADAYYDADTNDADEGNGTGNGAGGTIEVNYTAQEEEHVAALTGTAEVITMQEWIDGGCQIGDFWVWDEDGWAYWASPIESGETTGLLLDEIIHENPPSDSWYYGINVVGQFVTADDIGFLNGTGFYDTSDGKSTVPTANAEMLLERITGTDIQTPVEISLEGGVDTVAPNSSTAITVSYNGEAVTPTTINVQPADAGATVDDTAAQVVTSDATGAKYLNISAEAASGTVFVLTVTYETTPADEDEPVTFTAAKAITVQAS